MSDDIKGVFVRFYGGSLNEAQLIKIYNTMQSMTDNLVSIGTPVMGGDLSVITTLGTLRDPVPCVRQSDALAKLAEKNAEIARYRLALHQIVEAQERKTEPTYDVLRDCIHFADIALKGPEA